MSTNIKRFILKLLAFIPFAFIIYVVLVCLWGDFAPGFAMKNLSYRLGGIGHLHSRLAEVKKVKDVDVLVLGSSHAYREFDPRIFKKAGYTMFNLGSSAQTPIQTKVLLNRYLDQLNPKIVIYEVFPKTFSIDGVESALDVISNDVNDIHSLKMCVKTMHIKVFNTLLYGFYRDLTGRNKSFVEKKHAGQDTYISGGYLEKDIETFKHKRYEKQAWDFQENQFDDFRENINLLKSKGVKLYLVNSPIAPAYYKSYTNNHLFDKRMKQFGNYYDFNKILKLDDSLYFYDADHLNQNGVDIFDDKILSIMQK